MRVGTGYQWNLSCKNGGVEFGRLDGAAKRDIYESKLLGMRFPHSWVFGHKDPRNARSISAVSGVSVTSQLACGWIHWVHVGRCVRRKVENERP